eukprot:764970_1
MNAKNVILILCSFVVAVRATSFPRRAIFDAKLTQIGPKEFKCSWGERYDVTRYTAALYRELGGARTPVDEKNTSLLTELIFMSDSNFQFPRSGRSLSFYECYVSAFEQNGYLFGGMSEKSYEPTCSPECQHGACSPCLDGAACSPVSNTPRCFCDEGFTGTACAVKASNDQLEAIKEATAKAKRLAEKKLANDQAIKDAAAVKAKRLADEKLANDQAEATKRIADEKLANDQAEATKRLADEKQKASTHTAIVITVVVIIVLVGVGVLGYYIWTKYCASPDQQAVDDNNAGHQGIEKYIAPEGTPATHKGESIEMDDGQG